MAVVEQTSQDDLAAQVLAFTTQWPHGSNQPLTATTSLLDDLGMDGDDAWEFLVAFSQRFNVDGKSLMFAAHFHGESMWIIFQKADSLKPLTVGDLFNAAQSGKFDIYTPEELKRFATPYKRMGWKESFKEAFGMLGFGKRT